MKIVVKTLNGKTKLPLDIEPSWTIRQVKEQIEKEHDMKAEGLKLVAYGKVLENDDGLVSDYSLKEGDFVVAINQKAKPAPKVGGAKPEDAKMEEPVQQPAQDQQQPAQVSNQNSQAQQPVAAQQQPLSQPAAASQAQAQQQLPPQVEAVVNDLMAISGKPRELCIQALIAAHNIPDIAFEFLMNPDMIPPVGGQGAGDFEDDQMEEDVEGEGEGDEEGVINLSQYNLDPNTLQQIQSLVSNPSFPLIRERMLQDPNFSQNFMAQLQTTQPAIFNAIQQNPGLFMTIMIGHDPLSGMGGGAAAAMGGHAQPHGHGAGGHHGGMQPPPGSLQVTAEEMEAINRLASLGFPKSRAAEAYFACDKNEEFAANFLFEAGAEDEDIATQNAIAASQAELANFGQNNPGQQQQQQNQANPAAQNQNNQNDPKDDKPNEGNEGGAGGDGGGSSLI